MAAALENRGGVENAEWAQKVVDPMVELHDSKSVLLRVEFGRGMGQAHKNPTKTA
jgi:hypothetical protein